MAQPLKFDPLQTYRALVATLNPANAANFTWNASLPLVDFTVPLTACIVYLSVVLYMYQLFLDRPPVRGLFVKIILLAHNLFLSLGSAVLLYFLAKEIYAGYLEQGFEPLVCDNKRIGRHINPGPVLYYFYIFYLSKFYEFIDTVFVIIKVSASLHEPSFLLTRLETRAHPSALVSPRFHPSPRVVHRCLHGPNQLAIHLVTCPLSLSYYYYYFC